MGVYPISPSIDAAGNGGTTNLREFDQAGGPGRCVGDKKGVQALPIHLAGQAQFQDSVGKHSGSDVKGHLTANNFDVLIGRANETGGRGRASKHVCAADG